MDNVFTCTSYTFTVVGICLLRSSHFVRLKEVTLKWKKQGLGGVGEGEVEGVLLFGSVNCEALLFYLISLLLRKLTISLQGGFNNSNMCVLTSDERSEPR